MDRDTIIRLAREAGLEILSLDGEDEVGCGDGYHIQTDLIERFAALVAKAERHKIAAWMIDRSYATGHGDTTEDLLKELEWQIKERERKRICEMLRERHKQEERHNYYGFIANMIEEMP